MKSISDPNQTALVDRSLDAVWHPCTQMKHHESFPLIAISHGKGAYLFDEQGNSMLDCISSWWTNLFGHSNPRINKAINSQLEKIEHVMLAGFTHPPVVELSEKLSALTQGHLGHVFYASDGASAVEIALKMSHHYWRLHDQPQKKKFICLENGYHGETLGALAVTDVAIFREAYGSLLQDVFTVPSPDSRKALSGESAEDVAKQAAEKLEQLLEAEHQNIAALIIEPLVQCAGQMAMYSPEYLKSARALCDRFNVHLIADEIAVGCGRSGKFFACEHAGIWPDFLTLSKGISGGYLPLSLSMTTDKIYRAFYGDKIQ
ncbi:MAG TPA: adenosylmethionine--8-amino-7-oxononanoate transaminase, partial [Polynucleobacter sp.]|nr:adenosylmethionine--8-amino-7-oxononanoate transaminase [Polynucleobacter sp.]